MKRTPGSWCARVPGAAPAHWFLRGSWKAVCGKIRMDSFCITSGGRRPNDLGLKLHELGDRVFHRVRRGPKCRLCSRSAGR